jgi:hypothetical protein
VTAACVITWIGASLTALMLVLTAVFLVSNGGTFTQEFRRQVGGETGLTGDDLLTILWGVVGVGLLWCLGAIVVAVLAFRRNRGGRIALAVSAALTVLVSLLAILSILSAVPLLMGIAVLVLLFTGGANDWYARRGGWSPPSGGPSGGQPYGQQYSQPGQYRQQGQPGQPAQPPQEHTGPW